ncbi:MAG TPA: hypothetical protein VMM59_03840 [Thermohalobaculum sp.]|nr:hypothetical protein [Thermohalobaculum sp.]
MPLANRVTPLGEIVAAPWRGSLMGNRGILHDAGRRLGVARWRHRTWIACVLAFRGRRRAVMAPGRYTELFFWDEACALAAGHRPCHECRRADARRFRTAWGAAGLPGATAAEIDRVLHAARVTRERRQVTHEAELADMPDGVFLALPESPLAPLLKWRGSLWRWSGDGYAQAGPARRGTVRVLTPAPIVAAIGAGYLPAVRLAGAPIS